MNFSKFETQEILRCLVGETVNFADLRIFALLIDSSIVFKMLITNFSKVFFAPSKIQDTNFSKFENHELRSKLVSESVSFTTFINASVCTNMHFYRF